LVSKFHFFLLVTDNRDFPPIQGNVGVEVCNGVTNEYFSNIQIQINPLPIPITQPGAQVTVNFGLDLLKPLTGGGVRVRISKTLMFLGEFEVPCENVSY
jgi:hypothetical protein